MSGDTSRIRVLIEASNEASPIIDEFAAETKAKFDALRQELFGDVQTSQAMEQEAVAGGEAMAGGLSASLTGLVAVGASLIGVLTAVKGLFDMGAEGAQIQRLEDSTTALAAGMGSNMGQIVDSVRAASLGTVSEFDIMKAAGRAMMLGVTSDADQMGQLMQVAAFRGRAMGEDATKAFDDIVTGIGRLSPRILDNIGIVVDAQENYQKYAASLGTTSDQLTESQKRQALLTAVISEGNKLMASSGGLTADNATAWERLSALWADVRDEQKKTVAEGLAPLVNSLTEQRVATQEAEAQTRKLSAEGVTAFKTYGDYKDSLTAAAKAAGLFIDQEGNLIRVIRDGGSYRKEIVDDNYLLSASTYGVIKAANDIPDDGFVQREKRMMEATADFQAKQEANRWTMDELRLFMQGPVSKENERYYQQQRKVADAIETVQNKLKLLNSKYWLNPAQKQQVADLQSQLQGLNQQTLQNTEDHTTAMKQMTFGFIEQRMAIDGLTTQEQDALMATAKQMGLVDQSTYNLYQQSVSWAQGLTDAATQAEAIKTSIDQIPAFKKITLEIQLNSGASPQSLGLPAYGSGSGKTTNGLTPQERRMGGGKKGLEGFASGGAFIVPGTGGTDSSLVQFYATPGEKVSIQTPDQAKGGAGVTLKNYGTIVVQSLQDLGDYARKNIL